MISSATVTPTFGIADITAFNFSVIAADPDGDSLTYAWSAAGNTASTATPPPLVFVSPGGDGVATVTVSDGKGGTANTSLNFTVGSMSGNWAGVTQSSALATFTMNLTQTAGFFTGTIATQQGNGQVGPTGALATINGSGNVVMRIKVAPFTDFTITGLMDTTGRRITGSLAGSGFTGQAVIMTKQ